VKRKSATLAFLSLACLIPSASAAAPSGCAAYRLPPKTLHCSTLAAFDSKRDVVNVRSVTGISGYLLSQSQPPTSLRGKILSAREGAVLTANGKKINLLTPGKRLTVAFLSKQERARTSSSGKDGAISPLKTRVAYFLLRNNDAYDTDRIVIVTVKSLEVHEIATTEFENPTFLDEDNFKVGEQVFPLPGI
jgi:hypothetical protein